MRKPLRITLGVFLIIVGLLAAITPLSPGSWLALIGLELLGLRIIFERKLLSLLPRKYRDKVKNLLSKKKKKPPNEPEK
jgi:membrane protein implicated in regulation of membrane protease activity